MTDKISELAGGAQEYIKSDDFKKILPYLLSGGAGAVAGGVMTGKRKKRQGEGRLSHAGRVLSNALMVGGLAAGGHALIRKGIEKTKGSMDTENPWFGDEENANAIPKVIGGGLKNKGVAAALGAGTLYGTRNWAGVGNGASGRAQALAAIDERTKLSPSRIQLGGTRGAAQGGASIDAHGPSAAKFRRAAGLGSSSAFGFGKKSLSDIRKMVKKRTVDQPWNMRGGTSATSEARSKVMDSLRRRNSAKGVASSVTRGTLGKLLGQTKPRIAGRVGLGSAAALISMIAGKVMTE